jgi:hypothetical protein
VYAIGFDLRAKTRLEREDVRKPLFAGIYGLKGAGLRGGCFRVPLKISEPGMHLRNFQRSVAGFYPLKICIFLTPGFSIGDAKWATNALEFFRDLQKKWSSEIGRFVV